MPRHGVKALRRQRPASEWRTPASSSPKQEIAPGQHGLAALGLPWPCIVWALYYNLIKSGASTREVVASSLMSTCTEGPAVSFRGSPTVSPTTDAA